MLDTLGTENTGVSKGLYLKLSTQISAVQSLYDGIKNTIGKITSLFGYALPEISASSVIDIAIAVQEEIAGITLQGHLGDLGENLTCLYKYSSDELSCIGMNLKPFTIIKNGLEWVVKKATKFFDKVRDDIRVKFEDIKKKIITNINDPADKFFDREAKLPSTCPPGMENSVG
jgi:hypothetical protein